MKQILPFLLFFFIGNTVFGQSIGDFLFIGMYADNPEGFAIVVINPLPASTNFYFTDDEWTGASINTSEGTVTWTTPAAGVPPGTVVTFNNIDPGSVTITASNGNPGTASLPASGNGSTWSLSGSNEAIMAYVGAFQAPTTFISVISNESFADMPGGLVLSGTGLTTSNAAVEFNGDEDSMTFDYATSSCASAGMSAACVNDILNIANWTTDNGATNDTDISDVPLTTFAALPVELTSFVGYAKGQFISLEWQTSTEINNDYFSIQKSLDGKEFQEIAIEYGAGTTHEEQLYSFIDERPYNGVNYYRLKQVDYDGQFAYTEVISVDFGKEEIVSIAPNPVREVLTISNPEEWNGAVELAVYSINGQILKTVRYDNPDNRISLNVQDLRAGIYHVQITANNQVTTQRFVKN